MTTYPCGVGQVSPRVTISVLPDSVLLDIFDFYRARADEDGTFLCMWHRLVHVCQRWRYVVFSHPLRLDLRLYCLPGTRVREMLEIWSPLPIEIWSSLFEDEDNIIAALEQRNHVCSISLDLTSHQGSYLTR
jgi:hypothetical protein